MCAQHLTMNISHQNIYQKPLNFPAVACQSTLHYVIAVLVVIFMNGFLNYRDHARLNKKRETYNKMSYDTEENCQTFSFFKC